MDVTIHRIDADAASSVDHTLLAMLCAVGGRVSLETLLACGFEPRDIQRAVADLAPVVRQSDGEFAVDVATTLGVCRTAAWQSRLKAEHTRALQTLMKRYNGRWDEFDLDDVATVELSRSFAEHLRGSDLRGVTEPDLRSWANALAEAVTRRIAVWPISCVIAWREVVCAALDFATSFPGFGELEFDRLVAHDVRAMALAANGDYEAALIALEPVVAGFEKLSSALQDLRIALRLRASVLSAMDRPAEALAVRQSIAELWKQPGLGGGDDWLDDRRLLARVLYTTGAVGDALRELEDALACAEAMVEREIIESASMFELLIERAAMLADDSPEAAIDDLDDIVDALESLEPRGECGATLARARALRDSLVGDAGGSEREAAT